MSSSFDNEDRVAVFFENCEIRRAFHKDEWYYSVVDVVRILAQKDTYDEARKYWKRLLQTMRQRENSQLVPKMYQLKMPSADGKNYLAQVVNRVELLRLIQSIPSPRAEPFKLWLAQVGEDRLQERAEPAKAVDRAERMWQRQGKTPQWIETRLRGKCSRIGLTNYMREHNISHPIEFAKLTNVCHQGWSGLTVKQHKEVKRLAPRENLRDFMTRMELAFSNLSEEAALQFADHTNANGFKDMSIACSLGGQVAFDARKSFESKIGQALDLSTAVAATTNTGDVEVLPSIELLSII
jgi:prophage antirepressor-like protein